LKDGNGKMTRGMIGRGIAIALQPLRFERHYLVSPSSGSAEALP